MTRIQYSVIKMMLETGPARLSRKTVAGVGVLVLEQWHAVQYLAAVLAKQTIA
jgi:hypothetical protein